MSNKLKKDKHPELGFVLKNGIKFFAYCYGWECLFDKDGHGKKKIRTKIDDNGKCCVCGKKYVLEKAQNCYQDKEYNLQRKKKNGIYDYSV